MMCVSYTEKELLQLDARYAKEGIPFHARPLRAAAEILKEKFVMGGAPFGNAQVAEICATYEKLIPETLSTWPGMGTGLVASLDRVRSVVVGVVFGTPLLTAAKALGFSTDDEWHTWCRKDATIVSRSCFAFADMYDLIYGIDALRHCEQVRTIDLLCKATEQLTMTSLHLAASGDPGEAILQTIGLTAELALKGSLLHFGVPESSLSRRNYGHNCQALAERLIKAQPHRDDEMLVRSINMLPDYVESRYQYVGMTRLQIIDLALGVQFVAASAVRRIIGRDLAADVEATSGPRARYFS